MPALSSVGGNLMRRFWAVCLLWLVFSGTGAAAAGYDDFAEGMSAVNAGHADRAVKAFTAALADGDLSPNLVPIAYFQRARAYMGKGRCDLAHDDLTVSAKLKADYEDVYLLRAASDECAIDYPAAVADLGQAIALHPMPATYFGRGRARWYTSDFAGAASDFEKGLETANTKAPYTVLWLELCRMRAGALDPARASDDLSDLDLDGWPAPLFDLFRGRATPDDVKAAAAKGDTASAAGRQCEADFYIGEWWLAKNNNSEAKPLIDAARSGCPHNLVEYRAATVEFERLK